MNQAADSFEVAIFLKRKKREHKKQSSRHKGGEYHIKHLKTEEVRFELEHFC